MTDAMMLEVALEIALKVHKGQLDKGGSPYILHPIRVMQRVEGVKKKVVALLHDTEEDGDITSELLRGYGFDEEIIAGVDGMTRREGESYMTFIRRAKQNPISRGVKIADIQENMDLSRIKEPIAEDYRRVEKYRKALSILLGEDD